MVAPQVRTRDGFALWRTEMPVPRESIGFTPKEGGSLPLEIRESAFRFAGERFLKPAGQSLIEGAARFGLWLAWS